MTATQERLFEHVATRGASRGSDPRTSVDAGRSMSGAVLRDQQALVLSTVAAIARAHNDHRATAYDVAQRLGDRAPQQNVIARRLTELTEAGMVRPTESTRPGSSGRHCRCYALTDKARDWLEVNA